MVFGSLYTNWHHYQHYHHQQQQQQRSRISHKDFQKDDIRRSDFGADVATRYKSDRIRHRINLSCHRISLQYSQHHSGAAQKLGPDLDSDRAYARVGF